MKVIYYFFLTLLLFPLVGAAQNESGKLINLGTQVSETWLEGSTFADDDAGNKWIYTVLRGKPGYLLGINLTTNTLDVNLPLEKMDGAWDINVSSDGWIYIAGSAGGRLARHRPGSQQIEDLGKPLTSETYLFAVVAGKNGEMFGATYPGCRVFRYHPSEGFSDVGSGPIVPGENYVHGLAYHAGTDKVFAGIGSHSYLVELDPRTGEKRELLPEAYRGLPGFVYDMGVVKGLDGGDRLLANLPDLKKTIVYNLDKRSMDKELKGSVMVKSAIKSPDNQEVFYTTGTSLYSLDLTKPTQTPKKLIEIQKAMAMSWGKDKELYILSFDGKLIKYNPKTNSITPINIELPTQPVGINITKLGPDGRIWTSGYLVGSNSAYDPESGKVTHYSGLHQSESITVNGSNMYFGIYPGGKLYLYNTKLPWNLKGNAIYNNKLPEDLNTGNPKLIGEYPNQDRPFAGVKISDSGKMLFGTVPDYGRLGGALIEYDPETGKSVAYENVFPDLSVVSLINAGGQILVGTSVWGGLGIKPAVSDAKLFTWDPVTKKKTYELIPVPNAKAITCLINGPDGNVWGVADGVLFIFNPLSHIVVSQHKIFEVTVEKKNGAVWRDVNLIIHPSGQIYGTGNGGLFRIDPKTKNVTNIKTGVPAFFLSMDKKGRFYFRDGKDLWQFTPAENL